MRAAEARRRLQRRKARGGSFVVFQGQPPGLQRRQANQLKQMTELQRTCTGLDQAQLAVRTTTTPRRARKLRGPPLP